MLERPDLQDEKIAACLREAYGLRAVQLAFLPIGADSNTAVYRVVAEDHTPYFLKLRRGDFAPITVTLPKYLSEDGFNHVIPPLATEAGKLWTGLDAYTVILYPFVDGCNGYEVALSETQWRDFGAALKRLHTAAAPPALASQIPREGYSPQWREMVKGFLFRLDETFTDPIAMELSTFLKSKDHELRRLAARTERLAQALQSQTPEFVVCHSDAHAGNLLIDTNGTLYIVDWDNPILAPKERDLMFPGGAQGFIGRTPQEEERLFYLGYGPTQINPVALAYYRYERIIQDIAIYCEQIFSTTEGGEDRPQALHYLKSNFLPNNTLELAYRADKALADEQTNH